MKDFKRHTVMQVHRGRLVTKKSVTERIRVGNSIVTSDGNVGPFYCTRGLYNAFTFEFCVWNHYCQ